MTEREGNDREWRERLAPLAPPEGAVDWAALEARILERARAALEGRRLHGASPWEVLAGWARPGLAAAAAVLVAVAAAMSLAAGPRPTLEEALRPSNGETPAGAVVLASSEPSREAVARLVLQPTR